MICSSIFVIVFGFHTYLNGREKIERIEIKIKFCPFSQKTELKKRFYAYFVQVILFKRFMIKFIQSQTGMGNSVIRYFGKENWIEVLKVS